MLVDIRRNFKKKVRVTKDFHTLKVGDILESVTQRRGNYSGLLKRGNTLEKRHVPVSHAEDITNIVTKAANVSTDNKGIIFHCWGEKVPSKTYVYVAKGRENVANTYLKKQYGEHSTAVAASCSMPVKEIKHFFI